jgi:hypothetical protein
MEDKRYRIRLTEGNGTTAAPDVAALFTEDDASELVHYLNHVLTYGVAKMVEVSESEAHDNTSAIFFV